VNGTQPVAPRLCREREPCDPRVRPGEANLAWPRGQVGCRGRLTPRPCLAVGNGNPDGTALPSPEPVLRHPRVDARLRRERIRRPASRGPAQAAPRALLGDRLAGQACGQSGGEVDRAARRGEQASSAREAQPGGCRPCHVVPVRASGSPACARPNAAAFTPKAVHVTRNLRPRRVGTAQEVPRRARAACRITG
jgi:hypothetical protein